jgi:reprolysin-like metallo-peptidase family M12B
VRRRLFEGAVCLVAAAVLGAPAPVAAQGTPPNAARPFYPVAEQTLDASPTAERIAPGRRRVFGLDGPLLLDLLARTPREGAAARPVAAVFLDLPWSDGGFRRFRVEESPIMEPELAAQFPEIETYRGQGIDDGTATVRFDWTPAGFHAMVLSAEGTVYIDPYAPGDTRHYVVYDKRDHARAGQPLRCLLGDEDQAVAPAAVAPQLTTGATLRTYRLAVAATGEYTAFFGGTVPGAMAGITTTVNRVDAIYERDLAVRLVLVAGNASIVYTDPAGDPYSNSNGTAMLCQNARTLDAVILSANYDIGHVFATGSGGLAGLGAACRTGGTCDGAPASFKAYGTSGVVYPQGDGFDVDLVAHEIGHQLGADHTFNGSTSSCQGQRATASAYEPGSGSTVMSYAGICASEDLQPHADAYFHARSLDQIASFVGGSSCPVSGATANTPPAVEAGPDFTVPSRTPFTLTAAGSDADGDVLTYAWEEFDLGTVAPPNQDNGTRPIFRSFPPTASPARTFPRLSDLLANVVPLPLGESLPVTTRTMTFRVTARDNRSGGGGTASDVMHLNVRADSGPFLVTQPNTAVGWPAGSTQTVTWDVANTAPAPVSCATVRISLSLDGGVTFPIVLAANTPNDGTQAVTLPLKGTSRARIKVAAVDNVFFDVSNADFTITPTAAT